MKKKYLFEQQASAKIENILRWFDYRVTLLSDNLFRIEKSHDGIFEDRATQAVLHRNMPIVSFTFIESDESIKIQTKEITLLLKKDFGSSVITVEGKEYFLSESVNLLGTYRTLDGFEGNRCMCEASSNHEGDIVELNNGVCAQNGFAIIDDNSFVVSKNGEFIARRKDNFDKYIFAYGKDYRAALKAFYDIEGYTPLIPRFALGNWWSRYYPYSASLADSYFFHFIISSGRISPTCTISRHPFAYQRSSSFICIGNQCTNSACSRLSRFFFFTVCAGNRCPSSSNHRILNDLTAK